MGWNRQRYSQRVVRIKAHRWLPEVACAGFLRRDRLPRAAKPSGQIVLAPVPHTQNNRVHFRGLFPLPDAPPGGSSLLSQPAIAQPSRASMAPLILLARTKTHTCTPTQHPRQSVFQQPITLWASIGSGGLCIALCFQPNLKRYSTPHPSSPLQHHPKWV